MYHPARNETTKNILECVINEWSGLGANTGGAITGKNAALFTQEQTAQRNLTIGNIATRCTTNGMVRCLAGNLVEGRLSEWEGRQPRGPEVEVGVSKLVCDQLGLTKVYKGTGR
jgi:hypothetical protein